MLSQGQTFSGKWSGNINGVPAILTSQQNVKQVQGKIVADGYIYNFQGNLSAGIVSGILSDPQTQGQMNFEMSKDADQLYFDILVNNIYTGETQRQRINFRPASKSAPSTPPRSAQNPADLDKQLVGYWSHTETIVSGEFSTVSQVIMKINPDGSYLYGNARTMASGSSDYGEGYADISADTGDSGQYTPGQWKVKSDILYVKEDGTNQWYPYAKYYLEGNTLMLTFGDNSRQLWYR